MTNQYEELIAGFEKRLRNLVSEYKSLKVENASLKEEIKRRKDDLMHANKDFLELKANYENVCAAKHLTLSRQQGKMSKQHINNLICEVEKCIALLEK